MSPLEIAAAVVAVLSVLAILVFWITMIRDCWHRTSPGSRERYVWLLIVILGKLPGAIAYFFLRDRGKLPGGQHRELIP